MFPMGIELASIPSAESLIKKLNEYQALINRKIDTLVDRKQEAVRIIDQIPDARLRSLLLYRYINGLKWSMIACLMGYAEEYVRIDLKRDALSAFERNLGKPEYYVDKIIPRHS